MRKENYCWKHTLEKLHRHPKDDSAFIVSTPREKYLVFVTIIIYYYNYNYYCYNNNNSMLLLQ